MPNRIYDRANKKSNFELIVRQNCLITNTDPKKSNNTDNKLSIALSERQTRNVKLNSTQYQLLEALAHGNDCGNNDDDNILTEEDLRLAKHRFKTDNCVFRGLDVVEFRYDKKHGIANITTKNGEVLRVDLETKFDISNEPERKTEKKKVQSQAETNSVNYLKEPKPKKEETNQLPELLDIIKLPPQMLRKVHYVAQTNYDDATGEKFLKRAEKPNLFNNIPKEYNKYIKQTAQNTGLSEYFIRNLFSLEAFIPKAKNIGDGVITIGFGHTNNADHNRNFKKGDPITIEKAFEWLEQDIKDNIKYARKYFTPTKGEFKGTFTYDTLPQSFKEAIVDIAFNRGTNVMASEKIYMSLRANFKGGYHFMPAAAVRTRQENFRDPKFEGGLRKRNVYRFLMAIKDLSGEYKLAAMRRFAQSKKDDNGNIIEPSYLKKTKALLSKEARKQLQRDWNAAMRAAEYQAQIECYDFSKNFYPEEKK